MNAPAQDTVGFRRRGWLGPCIFAAILSVVSVRYLATGFWTPGGYRADALLWWPTVLIFATACADCFIAFLVPARHRPVLTSRVIAVLMIVLPSALAGLVWLYKDYHEVLIAASLCCTAQ